MEVIYIGGDSSSTSGVTQNSSSGLNYDMELCHVLLQFTAAQFWCIKWIQMRPIVVCLWEVGTQDKSIEGTSLAMAPEHLLA